MSRKELADAGSISQRTMYSYIDSVWTTLVSLGCEKRKRLCNICANISVLVYKVKIMFVEQAARDA